VFEAEVDQPFRLAEAARVKNAILLRGRLAKRVMTGMSGSLGWRLGALSIGHGWRFISTAA
jgi:hypothetical protein